MDVFVATAAVAAFAVAVDVLPVDDGALLPVHGVVGDVVVHHDDDLIIGDAMGAQDL